MLGLDRGSIAGERVLHGFIGEGRETDAPAGRSHRDGGAALPCAIPDWDQLAIFSIGDAFKLQSSEAIIGAV